ncbi:MAG: hypothetical protein Q7T82_08025 [Armatimonadota bacterium]|nr:hypothetical protein [Armatimonadota bacterium]
MRLVTSLLCLVLAFHITPNAGAAPLITDQGDQMEPDVYGASVVYRDRRYAGTLGYGVVAYDLVSGSKTVLNPTWSADNRPAVGESRAVWCDRRWNGSFGIVSTVIGSGVEDVIVQSGASAWGLDVNDRWVMWYRFGPNGETSINTFSFATSSHGALEPTRDSGGYYDVSTHLDHTSDRVMYRTMAGAYVAIDLASGLVLPSTVAEYELSSHAFYNGCSVWDEIGPQTGWDVHISNAAITTIGAAKFQQDGIAVSHTSKVVTAVFQGCFYAEEPDRSSAVRVVSNTPVQVGQNVRIQGRTNTAADEREVLADLVSPGDATAQVLPLGMSNRVVGGGPRGYQSGVAGGAGLNNIGLLVSVWGRVTQIGGGYLYINDGCDLGDGTLTGSQENVGIRVICDPADHDTGDYLVVTGISSCFRNPSGGIQRRILTRGAGDVR